MRTRYFAIGSLIFIVFGMWLMLDGPVREDHSYKVVDKIEKSVPYKSGTIQKHYIETSNGRSKVLHFVNYGTYRYASIGDKWIEYNDDDSARNFWWGCVITLIGIVTISGIIANQFQ